MLDTLIGLAQKERLVSAGFKSPLSIPVGDIFNSYTNTRTETINARLSLEPFKGMRVELTANRTLSENRRSFFRWNSTSNEYVNDSPNEFGNFSVSMLDLAHRVRAGRR